MKHTVATLGSIAAVSLLAVAIPAQATSHDLPEAPSIKLSFVPKTVVSYTGKYCNSSSKRTQKAAIALSGFNAMSYGARWDIEVRVKKPKADWGRSYIAYGPNYGSIPYPGLPKKTVSNHKVSKPGTYQMMFRLQEQVESGYEDGIDGGYETVYGPWSAPKKFKVTKNQLKRSQTRTSKEPCD